MGKVLVLMGLSAILGFGAPATAQTDRPAGGDVCTLKVKGMSCSACASKVEQTTVKLEGVKSAKVNQPKGTAEIIYDASKTTPAAIAKYISDNTGFKAEHESTKAPPKG